MQKIKRGDEGSPAPIKWGLIMTSKASIEVFSTCPYSSAVERERFLPNVVDVARWSEQAGCRGFWFIRTIQLWTPG